MEAFLKQHGVLLQACRNRLKAGYNEPMCSVISAFTWENTFEGQQFWSRLNDKFKIYRSMHSIANISMERMQEIVKIGETLPPPRYKENL